MQVNGAGGASVALQACRHRDNHDAQVPAGAARRHGLLPQGRQGIPFSNIISTMPSHTIEETSSVLWLGLSLKRVANVLLTCLEETSSILWLGIVNMTSYLTREWEDACNMRRRMHVT